MSFLEFPIQRYQFTLVAFAMLVALGLTSFLNIPRQEDPHFPVGRVRITVPYPGAEPQEVERLADEAWLRAGTREEPAQGRHPEHLERGHDANAAGVRRAASWTQLVVGDDDKACSVDDAVAMAAGLKVDLDVIPRGAHLNTDAGYGAWPAVRDWVRDKHTRMITNR